MFQVYEKNTLTDMTTTSTSGISLILHGGSVNLFGPMCWLGEHRSLNTGSKRILAPRDGDAEADALVGNSTRKHACPSHVDFILSAFEVAFPESSPQVGRRLGTLSLTSFGTVGEPKAKLVTTYNKFQLRTLSRTDEMNSHSTDPLDHAFGSLATDSRRTCLSYPPSAPACLPSRLLPLCLG